MRVIQERDGNNAPTVSYTRGNDLSGSLEGAGGIDGLLARSHGYSSGSFTNHNFYHADGNGNVTYLVTSSQTLAASYRYDPFGNTISSSGSLAAANTYRFSSKESASYTSDTGPDLEFYYYGYRWYSPNWQRWLNRDPLGEVGAHILRNGISMRWREKFPNQYLFAHNNPAFFVDPFGLFDWPWPSNGSVNNCSDRPVTILINHQYYTLDPGESTADYPGNSDDVDGVWVDGQFYPVEAGQNFDTCKDPKDPCEPKSRGVPTNKNPLDSRDPPIPPYVPPEIPDYPTDPGIY